MGRARAGVVTLCRDACGLQAQVNSAAEMQLWARNHHLTRAEIQGALWTKRTLVKTSLMRQTLHWIPAAEFSHYIAALKRSRSAFLRRIMAKYASVTPKDIDALMAALVEALRGGPLSRRELAERIAPRVSKQGRKWMKIAWGIMTVRPALVEGLICYGPDRGGEVTYSLTDRWLPRQKAVEEREAKRFLLRRYLSAYGPATLRDFCKWSGIPGTEATLAWEDIRSELIEVSLDGAGAWLLRRDRAVLERAALGASTLRLLPSFDSFLLGHAAKAHLVDTEHYKKVYRNQGWISPVVLLDGRVIGTWAHKRSAKKLSVEVRPLEKPSRAIRAAIEAEAASLGDFLETSWQVKYARR